MTPRGWSSTGLTSVGALNKLFEEFAQDPFMTVYSEASPELLDLAEAHHMTDHMKWFFFLDGLHARATD